MRFMILVKATKESEAGVMPTEELLTAMADYHEQLSKAGVLLDGNGLHPSSRAWRINWAGGRKTIVDGPFAEAKELVAGYTIIDVKSREEALEWTRRFPNPSLNDGEIEVRQMFELSDFGDVEALDRLRKHLAALVPVADIQRHGHHVDSAALAFHRLKRMIDLVGRPTAEHHSLGAFARRVDHQLLAQPRPDARDQHDLPSYEHASSVRFKGEAADYRPRRFAKNPVIVW